MAELETQEEPKRFEDNLKVARVLKQIGDMLEFRGENVFKVRSYRMASETIDAMRESIAELVKRGGAAELQKIEGIGKTISGHIIEILDTGTSTYLQSLGQEIPLTVLDLLRVSGIGLKTAQTLYRDFGVKSLGDLRHLAEGGGLKSVAGIGPKTIERIMRSLNRLEGEQT